MENVRTHYRTHTCGELRMEHVGQTVTLAGFLENVREVGQNFAFAVLRDFYGTTQVVAETEEMVKTIKALNKESTVAVTGVVRERDSKNPKLPTGDIEVVPQAVDDAVENARRNGVTNARFLCGDASQLALQLGEEGLELGLLQHLRPHGGAAAGRHSGLHGRGEAVYHRRAGSFGHHHDQRHRL